MVACFCVFVCVNVCADAGAALENGEQEVHGVQKPGKIFPTISSAAILFPEAT